MNMFETTLLEAAATEAISIAQVDAPEALKTILKPGIGAALWQRDMPKEVQSWLDALKPDALPRARVVLQPHAVSQMITHLADVAEMPKGPERAWFEADVTALAARFSNLMETPYLRLRLDVISSNACRKFHIDAITARLLCTYRGTGTQYGISEYGEEPNEVSTVATGAPLILRGTLWPSGHPADAHEEPAEPPAKALLHRSPPIEGTGETRLVLVLDPVTDLDDDF
ncbi:MAG: DUF1826 domain-containing protein [Pseudomonadota bacterium]